VTTVRPGPTRTFISTPVYNRMGKRCDQTIDFTNPAVLPPRGQQAPQQLLNKQTCQPVSKQYMMKQPVPPHLQQFVSQPQPQYVAQPQSVQSSASVAMNVEKEKQKQKKEDDIQCAICLDTFKNIHNLIPLDCSVHGCIYSFHDRCILDNFKHRLDAHLPLQCPCCRRVVSMPDFTLVPKEKEQHYMGMKHEIDRFLSCPVLSDRRSGFFDHSIFGEKKIVDEKHKHNQKKTKVEKIEGARDKAVARFNGFVNKIKGFAKQLHKEFEAVAEASYAIRLRSIMSKVE